MVATSIELRTVNVTLRGVPPGLLMNSKRLMEKEAEEEGKKKGQRRTPAQEAELHCHWTTHNKKKVLAFPWAGVYKSICDAASNFKPPKGIKKSMPVLVAATISCPLDFVPLNTSEYEVYEEWVRIPPRTGAMVKIGRPRIREWEASFPLLVDEEFYQASVLETIIRSAGKMVGIGPWRPSLKGAYGKFSVARFDIQ